MSLVHVPIVVLRRRHEDSLLVLEFEGSTALVDLWEERPF